MSSVNIKRTIENINSKTTVYTPIIELVVNAIQAIDKKANNDQGLVKILVKRSPQEEIDNSPSIIDGISVWDNGIGFTDENRNSFDTLYSDQKQEIGGKGFGRFTCLKYFEGMKVESVYQDLTVFKLRKFSMGKNHDIIENEVITSVATTDTYSLVTLDALKNNNNLGKKLETIASNLVEKLLPYFITKNYICPRVILSEIDGFNSIVLNDYVSDEQGKIKELTLKQTEFNITKGELNKKFELRAFKIYSPKNHISKISLVADKREVTESSLHSYVPEFHEEFYDKQSDGSVDISRNYIIKTYVFSDYLDEHVSLERGAFDFVKNSDLLNGISQEEIEARAAMITKDSVIEDISSRQDKKIAHIKEYVEMNAPWHKNLIKEIDLSDFPYNPNDADLEAHLQKKKYLQELAISHDVKLILENQDLGNNSESVAAIVNRITDSSKNDLIHYIALRKSVLDLLGKSLELNKDGKYSAENVVHDIIFPVKTDSESIKFDDHNLWIIDERLNFTSYIASDLPLNGPKTERPDVIVYNHRVAFRGDNEASNPITVFEFKKPGRDDFVNPSSDEDPVQQIIRYVNNIRDGKVTTPEGKKIYISDNTPFFGYVVCELNKKVEDWLHKEKDFKPMADNMGWFRWMENINLYIEVICWDKLLKDAKMRNRVFFHHLGIEG
jgi:hypothetical protein